MNRFSTKIYNLTAAFTKPTLEYNPARGGLNTDFLRASERAALALQVLSPDLTLAWSYDTLAVQLRGELDLATFRGAQEEERYGAGRCCVNALMEEVMQRWTNNPQLSVLEVLKANFANVSEETLMPFNQVWGGVDG